MQASRFESNIRSLKVSRQFLIVLILLFVALMIWTFISIGASQNKTTLSPELITISKPLNPTIDRDVLTRLQTKEYLSPEEIGNFTIYKLVNSANGKMQTVVPIDTVEPTINTTSQSSGSATPSPTPSIEPTSTPSPSPEVLVN